MDVINKRYVQETSTYKVQDNETVSRKSHTGATVWAKDSKNLTNQ